MERLRGSSTAVLSLCCAPTCAGVRAFCRTESFLGKRVFQACGAPAQQQRRRDRACLGRLYYS